MTYITKRSGFHLVDHLAVCARARVPEIPGSRVWEHSTFGNGEFEDVKQMSSVRVGYLQLRAGFTLRL